MSLTPEKSITIIEDYFISCGYPLSSMAKKIIVSSEEIAYEYDTYIYEGVYLTALIKELTPFQSFLLRKDCLPQEVLRYCFDELKERKGDSDPYGTLPPFDASAEERRGFRNKLYDAILACAKLRGRNQVFGLDVLGGFLDFFDEINPVLENGIYLLELATPYNTLEHIVSTPNNSLLMIKFEEIRSELLVVSPHEIHNIPIEAAPNYLRPSVKHLLSDFPVFQQNCFLMMSFADTPPHKDVVEFLKQTMSKWGFNLLRADDKAYTDDLLSNIETYIYGCSFGIALIERFQNDLHNVNVALETGYFMGLQRPVCVLKEKTVGSLQSDLQGRLYVQFDQHNLEALEKSIHKWLLDKELLHSSDD